jgi:hypothetical protein
MGSELHGWCRLPDQRQQWAGRRSQWAPAQNSYGAIVRAQLFHVHDHHRCYPEKLRMLIILLSNRLFEPQNLEMSKDCLCAYRGIADCSASSKPNHRSNLRFSWIVVQTCNDMNKPVENRRRLPAFGHPIHGQ